MTAKIQEDRALNDTFSLVYEELRRLASSVKRSESSLTINSTALVDEAWVKLKGSPHLAATSPTHFKPSQHSRVRASNEHNSGASG
jgi:hypothetical protein